MPRLDESEVSIGMEVDLTDVEQAHRHALDLITDINRQTEKAQQELEKVRDQQYYMMRGMLSTMGSIINALPNIVGRVFDAILSTVYTTVSVYESIATASMTNPLTMWFGAALIGITFIASTVSVAEAFAGRSQAMGYISTARGILTGLEGIVRR